MFLKKRIFLSALFALGVTNLTAISQTRPWESSALSIESGLLWQVGSGTPLSYRLVPTQLSWRSREVLGHGFSDGTRLVLRHRFTLLGTYVQQGPESHYLAR